MTFKQRRSQNWEQQQHSFRVNPIWIVSLGTSGIGIYYIQRGISRSRIVHVFIISINQKYPE